jgi:hypothetical protein
MSNLASSGTSRPKVSNVHRSAIMQAAHRARRAFGVGMGEALRQAWVAFRKARMCHWPLDHLVLPHEQVRAAQVRINPAYQSRESLRLIRQFAL